MFVAQIKDDEGELVDPRDVPPPAQTWLTRAALPRYESILNARPEALSEGNQLELLKQVTAAKATLDWMLCKTVSSLVGKDTREHKARESMAAAKAAAKGRSRPISGRPQLLTLGAEGNPEVCDLLIPEIALELGMGERACADLIAVSLDLRYRLPATNAEFAAGRLTYSHARVISDITRPFSDDLAGRLDEILADGARERTPSRLRLWGRRRAAKLDPDVFRRRHDRAYADRGATSFPTDDGMAAFCFDHHLATIAVIDDQLDAWARQRRILDPSTSFGAHKADAAAHLLLGQHPITGTNLLPGPTAGTGTPADETRAGSVQQDVPDPVGGQALVAALADPSDFIPARTALRVTMSADTLLGLEQGTCELDGHGPITAQQARRLALTNCGSTTLRRVFTDPADDSVMFLDAQRYLFTTRQKEAILALHPVSCFPGAVAPGQRCDIDHRATYRHGLPHANGEPTDPPGQTVVSNGQPLGRRHHRLKTHGGWTCTVDPADPHTIVWTTPRGRVHRCRDHDGA